MEPLIDPAITPDQVRRQLLRIEEHPLFVRSARVRRFLEFTIESWLAGRTSELKEYVLGLEVFGRPVTHDPRLDPIVRVEARRVRSKLRAFYQTDGAQDDLLLEYPRGSYVPHFRVRSHAPALIAVLPFAPHAHNSCSRFAEGLTREVIHELGRSATVRLFSGENRPGPARIEALLTGAVRRTGHRLRVTTELLSTENHQNLWSAAFESAPTDPLTAQKQIAFAAVHSLSAHLRAHPEPHDRPLVRTA